MSLMPLLAILESWRIVALTFNVDFFAVLGQGEHARQIASCAARLFSLA